MSNILRTGILQQVLNNLAGPAALPFMLEINTELAGSANNTFVLPLYDIEDITVDWGDDTVEQFTQAADVTHVYPAPGIYTVSITGTAFQVVQFDGATDAQKVLRAWMADLGWGSAHHTFTGCSNLTHVYTSDGNWSRNVTRFNSFVENCTSLIYLDVSDWNTENGIYFDSFIRGCTSLQSLESDNWNTSNAVDFGAFAHGCTALQYLGTSGWDTRNVTEFNSFVYECSSLQTLDVSGWNTSNVETFSGFARGCTSLQTLDVSNWDTSNVVYFTNFARGCYSLSQLDMRNWNIENAQYLTNLATDVSIPTEIYDQILINWAAQNVHSGLDVNFGDSQYTAGGAAEAARNRLITEFGWSISDDGSVN